MTPEEQAAREIVERWECGCCPECEKKLCEHSIGYIARAIEQARKEEREAYAAIFDYAVNSQAAHHSEVCDCGLCRAIAAIRARAQEEQS